MHSFFARRKDLFVFALPLFFGVTGAGALAQDQAALDRAYEEAIRSLPSITVNGKKRFVIDGDVLVSAKEGKELLGRRNKSLAELESEIEKSGAAPTEELAVAVHEGAWSLWPETTTVLSYRILPEGFSTQQLANLRAAVAEAASDWNDACPECRIRFDEAEDSEDPLFTIEHFNTSLFYAAAFFPHDPVSERHLFVAPVFFTQQTFDRSGIIRHEFGHVLGYRHEHIRHPSLQDCKYEDGQWHGLTAVDPLSVMHYICGDDGDPELKLTELDVIGHRGVYGPGQSQ